MLILGADPGLSGAIAALDMTTGSLTVLDMPVLADPKSGKGILNMHVLYEMLEPPAGAKTMAVIENVHAMKGQGVSSTFRFGEGFGALQMAIIAHGFPIHPVAPVTWKKHFKLSKNKGASRALATQRFPTNAKDFALAKHDGRAEAALLALYGKEVLL